MPFQKGNKLGKRWKAGEQHLPALLRDYRHVYTEPEGKDTTEGQKAVREVRKKDPRVFMAGLRQMEKDWTEQLKMVREKEQEAEASVAEGGKEPAAEVPLADEGQVRVQDLIDQVLKEFTDAKVVSG